MARKHGQRGTVKVAHMSDGEEVWDILSEDYSISDGADEPPPKLVKENTQGGLLSH